MPQSRPRRYIVGFDSESGWGSRLLAPHKMVLAWSHGPWTDGPSSPGTNGSLGPQRGVRLRAREEPYGRDGDVKLRSALLQCHSGDGLPLR
jgi:hypothetical protein